MTRTLTILGSTGSIGTNTLDVVRRNRDRYSVHALVAGNNTGLLAEQIVEFRPRVAVVADGEVADILRESLQVSGLARADWPEIAWGDRARVAAATAAEADFVISAIVGVVGLKATYEAVRARKTVGLANKEVLVASGKLVMEAAREAEVEILPVDWLSFSVSSTMVGAKRFELGYLSPLLVTTFVQNL